MASSLTKALVWTVLSTLAARAADYPQAEISSKFLHVKLNLPDETRGYYRAMRFDWSGVIASLAYQGHEFFGVWFKRYDPLLNDAITGPVEEFRGDEGAEGYNQAKAGGHFIKIGVGVLRKSDDEPYKFGRTYTILNPGMRVVRTHPDRVEFIHQLSDGDGFAYAYKKTVRVSSKAPELILDHELKNTGKQVIDTKVYNHDFFLLDGQPTGPDTRVKFAFAPKLEGDTKGAAELQGNELVYQRELQAGESMAGPITGFGSGADANDFRVENTKAGIGVREIGDQPLTSVYFWSIRTTVCPEAYVRIHVEPGKTFRWRITYQFYLLGTKTKETGDGAS